MDKVNKTNSENVSLVDLYIMLTTFFSSVRLLTKTGFGTRKLMPLETRLTDTVLLHT